MARPLRAVLFSPCLLVIACGLSLANDPAPQTRGRVLSVCDVLKNIEKLNGQVVTVRAIFGWTQRHGGGLAQEGLDPYVQRCPSIDRRKKTWPPALHVTSPDALDIRDGPVSMLEEIPGYRELVRTMQDHERATGKDVLVATITGEVRTRKHLVIERRGDDIIGNGYGQVGACPAVLIVKMIVATEDAETHAAIPISSGERDGRRE